MNLAALSFRDLEYVVAVADNLHFGKAATACAVSQPTLSVQLRKLEEYIGCEIFERAGRTVFVTERGGELVEQARIILREGRKLYEMVQASNEPLTGLFRLGLIASLGPYFTPLLLEPLRDRFPRLQMVFSEGLTRHLMQSLDVGEVDAVLAAPPLGGPELMELPVFQEDLVLAVSRNHKLATAPVVSLEDINPDELILLNEGHCLREQTLALFPVQPKGMRRLQAAGIESLRQMVGAGIGCALLPRLAVQVGSLLDDMVAYRMIRAEPPKRSISLFHRTSFGRTRDVRVLRDVIREALQAVGTVTVHGPASATAGPP
jgi:LysR family hydrogen peroxide-inducible transcriptional activator